MCSARESAFTVTGINLTNTDMSGLIDKKEKGGCFMDKQKRSSIPAGNIRQEMKEIHQMQQAEAKDSMDIARYTKTNGGSFTLICC